ncbi:MAG: hypothetical protein NXI22_02490 [bacterium]|nr:hypothetical protein [bacterium]
MEVVKALIVSTARAPEDAETENRCHIIRFDHSNHVMDPQRTTRYAHQWKSGGGRSGRHKRYEDDVALL